MGLLFAGYETTSTTISVSLLSSKSPFSRSHVTHTQWIVHHLSHHPEWQEKLREELSKVDEPTYTDFQDKATFPILDAIVKETIRLNPPVLQLHRVVRPSPHIIKS